jgi:hypothetical protein
VKIRDLIREGSKTRAPVGSFAQNPPPYAEAAVKVTMTVWACAVCGQAWDERWAPTPTLNAERAARSCHTGQCPCYEEGCNQLTVPHRTLCPSHLAESENRRWLARPVVQWDGESMIYSTAIDEWFTSPDHAADHVTDELDEGATKADYVAALMALKLVVGEPTKVGHFDLMEFLYDSLPDDGETSANLDACEEAANALNKALSELATLSYQPGEARLDITDLVTAEWSPR